MINRLSKNGSKSLSQLSHAIESATDGNVKDTEDWSLFMGICDLINTSDDGPKEAIKTFKKRFASKHQQTIILTLSLLETCVKNCGKRFHVQLATKDFLQDFMKIINPKNNYSVALQNTVLGLLQTWAFAFQSSPELKEVNKTYLDLKNRGVEFPPLDPDKASPAYISPQLPSAIPVYHQPPPQLSSSSSSSSHPPSSSSSTSSSSSSSMNPQKIQKLKSELNMVQQNCKVFGDLLTEASQAGNQPNDDQQLLEDLNRTCRDMQNRILDLIQNTQIDVLTDDLLRINDELNNEFVRYDRFKRINKTANQTGGGDNDDDENILLHGGGANVGGLASPGKAANVEVVDNLIDLNDSPSAGATDVSLNSKMANLAVHPGYNASKQQDPFSPLQPEKNLPEAPYNPNLMKPDEVQEMEAWLKMNEDQSSKDGGSTATSSEFERFLADRVSAASNLPKH